MSNLKTKKIIESHRVPKCNFCEKDAEYDFKTIYNGMWAYGCKECFERLNVGGLGIGLGSELFGSKDKKRSE